MLMAMASKKTNDIFISYRRSNGSVLASLLNLHLKEYKIFLDRGLDGGKFDDKILDNVSSARNFVLLLTENALDRCMNDIDFNDWMHREIVQALQSDCNIIPITWNFRWPRKEELPEDIRSICQYNAIEWSHNYQEACIEQLKKFMIKVKTKARPRGRWTFSVGTGVNFRR